MVNLFGTLAALLLLTEEVSAWLVVAAPRGPYSVQSVPAGRSMAEQRQAGDRVEAAAACAHRA